MLMLFAELNWCLARKREVDESLLHQPLAIVEGAVDAQAITLSPQQVSCCSCRALTRPFGYRMTMRTQGRR